MLASLGATGKISDVNPVDYPATTLRAILDGHRKAPTEELMPWSFAQPSSRAQYGRAAALTDYQCHWHEVHQVLARETG